MAPTDPGHCAALPTSCNGVANCGCACQTPGGGPGFCAGPPVFIPGLTERSCQNIGATANVAIWCGPSASGSGGSAGGGAGATGAGGAS